MNPKSIFNKSNSILQLLRRSFHPTTLIILHLALIYKTICIWVLHLVVIPHASPVHLINIFPLSNKLPTFPTLTIITRAIHRHHHFLLCRYSPTNIKLVLIVKWRHLSRRPNIMGESLKIILTRGHTLFNWYYRWFPPSLLLLAVIKIRIVSLTILCECVDTPTVVVVVVAKLCEF